MSNKLRAYVNFLHEGGMLAKTPRSGFAFLGSGQQSVAEHCYRMALIAIALADLVKDQQKINREKLIMLCLYHDLPETRTGDLNYVNKKYVQVMEAKAIEDIKSAYPFGNEIYEYCIEFNECKTPEAILAHDADVLELMLVLKQLHEIGNSKAIAWFDNCFRRLKSDTAKKLADEIRVTSSDSWWFVNPDDPHWIHGGKVK